MWDVIRSPVADDPNNRVYYTGTVKGPRYTDNGLALSGGSNYPVNDHQLGMPEPDVAPVVTLSGTPAGRCSGSGRRNPLLYLHLGG